MNFITNPSQIESESMRYIRKMLRQTWPEQELPVVERLIHTTGDLALEGDILIHPQAIASGLKALRAGAPVITDVEMVRSGVAKKNLQLLGGKAECFLNDPLVAAQAEAWGLTRTMTALRLHQKSLSGSIVAIGNAPTALVEIIELAQDPTVRPALIVGMPVGFVGAKESKELLWEQQEYPSITVRGTRGGSPLAAATVNALIYMASGRIS
ncbi:precorrin-8X methylmutase [Paradesulfitobacterium ferrireducens]|uniref:precorrin-8X methylmutase n=1 Tax=Paradesulfitobacterium ferrireducens TaxID=2816476 RepID=UPI001A8E3D26|nr:precorrin-8X methylmutase [Paradesulfitobacterium ferrireducens]